jgi:hypothetical protein
VAVSIGRSSRPTARSSRRRRIAASATNGLVARRVAEPLAERTAFPLRRAAADGANFHALFRP